MQMLEDIRATLLGGGSISDEQAFALARHTGSTALRTLAKEVNRRRASQRFDCCSIINARSGRCPENCKWCAQSAHYNTGCEVYDFVGSKACVEMAHEHSVAGINRFSIVTSGRAARGETMQKICNALVDIASNVPINTCASLGLLSRPEFEMLWQAGVRRYHCNLETAPSFFPTLCSTHTLEQKLHAISIAKEIGFEICSGGIIGMGESMNQRIELALTLRSKVQPVSVPINILCPIPGTPLEHQQPISENEVIDTVAIFRLIMPEAQLRFAGGRRRLSTEAQLEAMHCGINGAIVGDLLTTIGSTMEQDRKLIAKAGYEI